MAKKHQRFLHAVSNLVATLVLDADGERSELSSVLSNRALAHCNSVESKDGSFGYTKELTSIEVQLDFDGEFVRHEISHVRGEDQKAIQDRDCAGVFCYPR